MDFVTGLPTTQKRHDAIWVVVDRLTKSAHFLPIRKNYGISKLAEIFQQEIVRLHGTPTSIVSDRDPKFTSRFWKGLQKAWGTRLKFSTAFHPQTDGQSERTIQTLEDMLRACALEWTGDNLHPLHVASYPFDQIQPDMSLSEEPESILDRQERVLRNKVIHFVKILWKNHPEREANWETKSLCELVILISLSSSLIVAMSVHNSVHNTPHNSDDEADPNNQAVTLISKLDLSHPLHLHPNDSTTLTIVSIKLKGTENYNVWSCAMLLALEGRNKIGFIDNTCRRSYTDEVLGRQWDRVNVVVMAWILNSILEELFLGQFFSKRAYEVWKELKETFDRVDGSVTFNLHHKKLNFLSLIKDNSLNDRGKGVQANMAGANQHLTYTDKNLVNVIDISYLRIRVSHPNGTEALITKVARDNKFIVGFDESKCFLMSHNLMDVKIMRIGKQVNDCIILTVVEDARVHVRHSSVDKVSQDLDHVNFFDEIVHEGPDTSYDDPNLNAPQGSNGSANENEMAATSDNEAILSKDDNSNIQTT
ncbi:retrotransposable element Tf2 [Tanacetum coccineum]|uniref:Retrotransposable element Tf2 n=1 Tax=Tanacetum coccineum TaxID=301880 RepID=A0ABQ5F7D6_9ASTR